MTKKIMRIGTSLASALMAGALLIPSPALAGEIEPQSGASTQTPTEAESLDLDEFESEGVTPLPLRVATSSNPGMKENCPNPVFMVYYRTWRDVTMPHNANSDLPDPNVIAMTDLPHGVDIVSLFHYVDPSKNIDQEPFWTAVREVYVPEMHRRGAKIVRTLDIGELFKPSYGLSPNSTPKEFDAAAQQILKTYVTDDGIDGIDIDMERSLTTDQQFILGGVYEALSKYLGPLSNTDKLLIYDTNRYATNSYIEKVAPYINYLFYQSYGAETQRLNTAIDGYSNFISSCQFLPGYTSPEELDNNRWYDTIGPIWESNAIAMARWQPEGAQKGGIFQYAIDRDGMTYNEPDHSTIRPTTFEYAKRVIATAKQTQFNQEKTKALDIVSQLQALSPEEKTLFAQRIETAEYFEQIFDATSEAIEASQQNLATALAEAKEQAIAEVNAMTGLSTHDREAALAAITAATSVEEVKIALETARAAATKPEPEPEPEEDKEDGKESRPVPGEAAGELAKTGADRTLTLVGFVTLALGTAALTVARCRATK